MIFVDPRVGSAHLLGGLQALGLECELTSLEYGDCAFFGNGPDETQVNIGIELKNVFDLVNSMQSGRLAGHQIPGLVAHYAHVWLIVEGFYRARRKDGLAEVPRGAGWVPLHIGKRPVFWRDLENFLTSIEVQAGIHIRRTRTPNETARFIALLHGWWTKEFDEHRSLQVLNTPRPSGLTLANEDETTTRIRRVAACLPSIGWGRSKAVAERFGSIERLAHADVDEWTEIDGIGKTIAGQVVQAIRAAIPREKQTQRPPTRGVSERTRAAARGVRHPRRRANS